MNSEKKDSFYRQNWLAFLLSFLMFAVVLAVSYLITEPGLTPREIALSQVISTLMSIVASVVVTKVFAEKTSSETLRDHGVQIARGVMVLGSQIDSLRNWVGKRRGREVVQPYDGALEHVELTLAGFKDMTDAALGGIAGIIGDALQQYQSVMDQISSARQSALEASTEIQERIEAATSSVEMTRLEAQLQKIAAETEQRVAEITRKSSLPIPSPELPVKRTFSNVCPYCKAEGVCEMPDVPGHTMAQTCGNCQRRFNNHVTPGHKVMTRFFMVPSQLAEKQERIRFIANNLADRRSAVLFALQGTQSWVDPAHVRCLLPMLVRLAGERRDRGETSSPGDLQSLLFSEVEKKPEMGVSNKSVRTLMKMLYQGRAFDAGAAQRMTFRTPFVNQLDPAELLKAYLSAALFRLEKTGTLTTDVSALSEILLGEATPAEGRILAELARGRFGGSPKSY